MGLQCVICEEPIGPVALEVIDLGKGADGVPEVRFQRRSRAELEERTRQLDTAPGGRPLGARLEVVCFPRSPMCEHLQANRRKWSRRVRP